MRDRQQETPLRLFLQMSMLSTDTEAKADGTDNENVRIYLSSGGATHQFVEQKVTISTYHTAKGLEWPVVILPGGKLRFHSLISII